MWSFAPGSDSETALFVVLILGWACFLLWRIWKVRVKLAAALVFAVGYVAVLGAIYWLLDLFMDPDQWWRSLSERQRNALTGMLIIVGTFGRNLFLLSLGDWARERLRRKYGRAVPPLDEAR